MSADNYLTVVKAGDEWQVRHGFMSVLCDGHKATTIECSCATEDEAWSEADAIEQREYIEYGVIEEDVDEAREVKGIAQDAVRRAIKSFGG